MLMNKILTGSRYLLQRNALPLWKVGEGVRNCHVVAAPPKKRVSNAELAVLGTVLTTSMWFVPYWVMYYIPDYQNEDRYQYTGK